MTTPSHRSVRHSHCHPAEPGKQKAIKIVADIKNKAREDVFRSAAAIVEDAILKEIKPKDPEASVPKPGLLIRRANRLRQAMRPEDPKDREFDISEKKHLTSSNETFTLMKPDICYSL